MYLKGFYCTWEVGKNSNWSGKTCYILSQLMVMEFPRLNDGEAVI